MSSTSRPPRLDQHQGRGRENEVGRKLLCGHIDHWEGFSHVPFAEALERDAKQYAHVAVISDGAKWILAMVVRILPSTIHTLDLTHVKERVGDFVLRRSRRKGYSMWI